MVQSSKRAVGRARNVVDVPKTVSVCTCAAFTPTHLPHSNQQSRDPRFDTLSGQLNQEVFDKSYSFLNDRQASEIASLRAEVTQAKSKKGRQHVSEEDREAMEKRLQSLESRAERQQRQRKDKDQVKARKESERKQRAEGKKPYFLKKCTLRVFGRCFICPARDCD